MISGIQTNHMMFLLSITDKSLAFASPTIIDLQD